MSKRFGLSSNMLKIIAAVAMTIDHIGLMIFPSVTSYRIIGRLAFPIFAFLISEGARYTRNKLKYLLSMLSVGAGCQIVYYVAMKSTDMCILITFSISLLLIYLLDFTKKTVFGDGGIPVKCLAAASFILAVVLTYLACRYLIDVDYGFFGCMVPVLASLPDMRRAKEGVPIKKIDVLPVRILFCALGLILLAGRGMGIQSWSLLAVPLLLCYNGERGRLRLKYFFYVFYPVHLGLIYVAYYIIRTFFR